MLWWLETQETLVIVLIVFAFCYLLAALILVGLAILSRSPIAGAARNYPGYVDPVSGYLWPGDRHRARRPVYNCRGQYGHLLNRRGLLYCPTDDQ
jgi:hypothetical protein